MTLEMGLSRSEYLRFVRGHEVVWHTVRRGSWVEHHARFALCGARIVYHRYGPVCAPVCTRCIEIGVKRGLRVGLAS